MSKGKAQVLRDGAHCAVIAGTHTGKRGTVRDIHTSKSGSVTVTVVQADGSRFKTLAKNVATINNRCGEHAA